jgi:hypothetical protein
MSLPESNVADDRTLRPSRAHCDLNFFTSRSVSAYLMASSLESMGSTTPDRCLPASFALAAEVDGGVVTGWSGRGRVSHRAPAITRMHESGRSSRWNIVPVASDAWIAGREYRPSRRIIGWQLLRQEAHDVGGGRTEMDVDGRSHAHRLKRNFRSSPPVRRWFDAVAAVGHQLESVGEGREIEGCRLLHSPLIDDAHRLEGHQTGLRVDRRHRREAGPLCPPARRGRTKREQASSCTAVRGHPCSRRRT